MDTELTALSPAPVINAERLLHAADMIQNVGIHGLEFDMGTFCNSLSYLPVNYKLKDGALQPSPRCGMSACIGGWLVFLYGKPGDAIDEETAAGLTGLNAEQSDWLFYSYFWLNARQSAERIRRFVREVTAGEDWKHVQSDQSEIDYFKQYL